MNLIKAFVFRQFVRFLNWIDPGLGDFASTLVGVVTGHGVAQGMLGKLPKEIGPNPLPSRLLRPEYEIVPFIGRETELQKLTDWVMSDTPVAVSLITGGPGCGKSRLAEQLCFNVGKESDDPWRLVRLWRLVRSWRLGNLWHCGPLQADGLNQPEHFRPLAQLPGCLLLVIDYAERRSDQIKALMAAMKARDNAKKNQKVRLVLLARSADEWWGRLRGDFDKQASPFDKPQVLQLSPIAAATEADDGAISVSDIYQRSYQAFCCHLGKEVLQQDSPNFLSTAGADFLDIHLAALLAALGEQGGAKSEEDLLNALLCRELDALEDAPQWHDVSGQGLKQGPAMTKMLAWFGALDDPNDENEATKRLALLPEFDGLDKEATRRAAVAALRALYPPVPGGVEENWWGGIAPDRFTTFLTGKLKTDTLQQAGKLGKAPLTSLIRHLVWYEQRYPGDSGAIDRLKLTMQAGGLVALQIAIAISPQTGSQSLVQIAEELVDNHPEHAAILHRKLPPRSTILALLALKIAQQAYSRVTNDEERADWANDLSNRLSEADAHNPNLAGKRL